MMLTSPSLSLPTKQALTSTTFRPCSDPLTATSTVRVASLLPFITDIVHELNLSHLLVAVSHDCGIEKNKASIVTKPKLNDTHTKEALQLSAGWNQVKNTYEHLTSSDESSPLASYLCSFYSVDMNKLSKLKPTHILTHMSASTTNVFQPSIDEIIAMTKYCIPSVKSILSLNATTLSQIFKLHHEITTTLDIPKQISVNSITTTAHQLLNQVSNLHSSMSTSKSTNTTKSVAVVQWTQPTFLCGGYVPELIEIAGGQSHSPMPGIGENSIQINPRQLLAFQYVIFVPCALKLKCAKSVVDSYWASSFNDIEKSTLQTKFAVVDGVRLFSWLGLTNVVTSAQVIAEFIHGCQWFGHKGTLWQDWSPPL